MRATTTQERRRARENAERTLAKKLAQLKRLVTSISLWQRRAAYYAAQEAMTDEQRRQADADRKRRAEERRLARRPRQIVTE